MLSLSTVWNLADLFMALMAIVNLVAITLLGKYAFAALADYRRQQQSGILDPEFDPRVLPDMRGKILNCLKADYARIFKSEIITDLLKVLGCGVEVQGKAVKELNAFDLNNLRWSKVAICIA